RTPGQYRVAVVRDGRVEQVYVDPAPDTRVGNIYKGRIVLVEPAIQAAFLDIGIGRNGFLHVTDVEPGLYRHLGGDFPADAEPLSEAGAEAEGRRPPIQDFFRRGQEVTVSLIRDGVGGKGPTLSTYLSLASPSLVLVPCLGRWGLSRRVSEEERERMRRTLAE